ncbi:ssDNA-binding protein [Anaerospora hongkongensis]|uniref:ssDNA-binding protein n=1 Tax=Anaerospora hongkongensis TaxID=244830 RepID=UPI00289CCB2E|nr:ssDNA-binding protein [Anaerospora hongkongensis]
MKKIFVCSPYRGNIEKNTKRAVFAARVICGCGHIPVVPHLYFPQFLDDKDQFERIRGIEYGIELMKECDQLWLLGPEISKGMEYELEVAKDIYFFNANSRQAPQVVDGKVQPVLDQSEVYSACYGRISVTFYGYNSNGNRGIAAGLGNIQKLKDGEPLGGGHVKAADDFDTVDEEDFLA